MDAITRPKGRRRGTFNTTEGFDNWQIGKGGPCGMGDRGDQGGYALRCGSSRQEARSDSSLAPSLIEDEEF